MIKDEIVKILEDALREAEKKRREFRSGWRAGEARAIQSWNYYNGKVQALRSALDKIRSIDE